MAECPKCKSTAVVNIGDRQQCNACGHDWQHEIEELEQEQRITNARLTRDEAEITLLQQFQSGIAVSATMRLTAKIH